MKEFFSADVKKYKPLCSCKNIVFSLKKMIEDGHSLKYFGISHEYLNSRKQLEDEDRNIQKEYMEICKHNPINYQRLEEIKQRQEVLNSSRKQGIYNGRKMYNNLEIKRIEREIWYRRKA